jgi:hypothetical protein
VARSSSGTGAPQKAFQGGASKQRSPLVGIAKILVLILGLGAAGYIVANNLGLIEKLRGPKEDAAGDAVYAPKKGAAPAAAPAPDAAAQEPAADAPPAGDTAQSGDGAPPAAKAPVKEGPIVPPVYTLGVKWAKIPECRANGTISGGNFVAESARLDRVGNATVLSLRQGPVASPDRELLVYLRMGANEGPTNRTFTVDSETKTGSYTVVKRWKTDPKYAPTSRNYSVGYALKVELGAMGEDNTIPGKIYLALPDNEKSVVAGLFKASANLAQALVTQPGGQEEAQPEQSPGMDANMRRRYNLPGR